MTPETGPDPPTPAPLALRDVPVKLLTLPVGTLHSYPRNVRRATATEQESLQASIRQHGLMNALVACRARGLPSDHAWILDGNNRLACVRNLGLESVPVKLYDAELADEQIAAVIVVQDTTKKKLSARQIADIARELLDRKQFHTLAEVGRFLSLRQSQLSVVLRIRDRLAPALLEKDLPLTVQHALSGAADPAIQMELHALYEKGLLTRDGLVAEVVRRATATKIRKPAAVKVRVGKSDLSLAGTPAEVKGELESLLKALSKAESLGLGLTAVPDLIKGGAK